MQTPTRLISADEFWTLAHSPEFRDRRLELAAGEIVIMSPAGGSHGEIALRWGARILEFVERHDLGYVTAETGFILHRGADGDVVRAPDAAFIAKGRLPEGLSDGFIPLAPDLVVEVVSPTDTAEDVQAKTADYLKYGVRLIWFGCPRLNLVTVQTQASAAIKRIGDVLDGGDVLPGFSLPIDALFKRRRDSKKGAEPPPRASR
jgi:Uma2 family endonuclease